MNNQRNRPPAPSKAEPGLVGRGFHLLDEDDCPRWQGKVIADLGDGYFLLELAGWFDGEATQQIVMHLSEFALTRGDDGFSTKGRFVFYQTVEAMVDYYQRVLGPRRARRDAVDA